MSLCIGILSFVWAAPRRPEKMVPRKKTTQTTSSPSSKPAAKKETPVAAAPAETTSKPATTSLENVAVFIIAHPEGDPHKLAALLKSHPNFHATLIFPPHYFDEPARKTSTALFSMLQSSHQIEIALALENEPILPLLADLKVAGDEVLKWGVPFAWPDDVAAQIARASGKYQKRWSTLPSGFYPPYQSLTEPVVQTLKKFRLDWVIGHPSATWGTRFFGGTALLAPPKPPVFDELTLGSKQWAEKMAEWVLNHPFALVDTTSLEDATSDQALIDALVKKNSKLPSPRHFMLGQEFTAFIQNEWDLPKNTDPFLNDYSAWIASSQQKRAWTALADARQVIDTYQRSGHASLQRLDAATEEMCNAESGPFLLELGNSDEPTPQQTDRSIGERNFLATLSNIYRLCEAPVPANLSSWFATRTFQKTTVTKTPQNDGPFFEESAQSLTWNDPKNDDNGAGKYLYPLGNYPKGLFDLYQLNVSWTDSDVTVTATMGNSVTGKPTNIVPLIDVYIDVNRLADAGNTNALRQRGKTLITREAAWEYALTFTPSVVVLYQAVPGSNPRRVELKSAAARGASLSATFSRSVLRGDPKHWRLSVGVMGAENSRRQDEPTPSSILVNATEKNFGGGASGVVAPYIDLLAPTVEDQTSRIDPNTSGGPLTLPFVESQ